MALRTIGTAATTTLAGFVVGVNDLIPADVAAADIAILNDQMVASAPFAAKQWGAGYSQTGTIMIPNRGQLRLYPGDFIAWDSQTGFPIVISALAAAAASWVHT